MNTIVPNQAVYPNQPAAAVPQPNVQQQNNVRSALKFMEKEALKTLYAAVEPCAIPAELVAEMIAQHGGEVKDQDLLRVIALGLQYFYCQLFERARYASGSERLTARDLAIAIIYSGNPARVSTQFLEEFSRKY